VALTTPHHAAINPQMRARDGNISLIRPM
jgi:hypothetical protein